MRVNGIWVWTVLLAVVVLLNLPMPASSRVKAAARDGVVPFQNVLSWLANGTRGVFGGFTRNRSVIEERARLLTEIAELRHQLDQTEFVRRDNDELRKMVEFSRRQPRPLRLCEVISRGDVGGWWQTVTLNRGGDDGIDLHSPVIVPGGLVGRIASVSRTTSLVLLITDPGSRVSCRISGSDAFGILSGTGVAFDGSADLEMLAAAEPLSMTYVATDHEIRSGDVVVTSGLGGLFPEGVVVGYVLKAALDSSHLFQRLTVAPAARLAALRYVFVMGG